jgi:hypothetical protein
MLGYIVVVDSPYFGQTDRKGTLILTLPDGNYRAQIWHPRIQDKASDLNFNFQLNGNQSQHLTLKRPLLPSLVEYEEADEFSDYDY